MAQRASTSAIVRGYRSATSARRVSAVARRRVSASVVQTVQLFARPRRGVFQPSRSTRRHRLAKFIPPRASRLHPPRFLAPLDSTDRVSLARVDDRRRNRFKPVATDHPTNDRTRRPRSSRTAASRASNSDSNSNSNSNSNEPPIAVVSPLARLSPSVVVALSRPIVASLGSGRPKVPRVRTIWYDAHTPLVCTPRTPSNIRGGGDDARTNTIPHGTLIDEGTKSPSVCARTTPNEKNKHSTSIDRSTRASFQHTL